MGRCTVLVVAAGASRRFGGSTPKVLVPWRGRPLLRWTLDAVSAPACVTDVVLVASDEVREAVSDEDRAAARGKLMAVVPGGDTRQGSVRAGCAALPADTDVVLVHDGARPFVSPDLVEAIARAAEAEGAALPLLPVADTVKEVSPGAAPCVVIGTLGRERLRLAQTPQGFRRDVLEAALRHADASGADFSDDAGMVEAAVAAGALPPSLCVVGVPGEASNRKVTTMHDLPPLPLAWRVGLGHDIHPLEPGLPFRLAGVDLFDGAPPGPRFGPKGHSDGDALLHATCDALLSAAGLGDIGSYFADTASENRGRDSREFVAEVRAQLEERGLRVAQVSAVVRLEAPRISPHAPRIRAAIAELLGVPLDRVGLSAKRGEGLGPIGAGEAVQADVIALVHDGGTCGAAG